MNIWLIQIGEPLPLNESVIKMRTALLADELVRRGHTLLWWASAFDHVKKKWVCRKDGELTINEKLRIFAIGGIGYRKNISLSRFVDHRIIARKFRKLAEAQQRPDAMVVSMPSHDLAYQSVMFAKKHNIPIIVDIRDEWPDLFVNYTPSFLKPLIRLFLWNDFRMMKQTMKNADSLLSMMNSLLEWGLAYADRKRGFKDRVFYLGGPGNSGIRKNANLSFSSQLKNKFVVTFIGTFVENNDPAIIVECARKLQKQHIFFVLAGDGELLEEVKKKADNLSNIIFPGWLNAAQIDELLTLTHVGIAPAKVKRDAFPNKVFSYFSSGVPVITAFEGDLKQIIESQQVGFYYPPNQVDVLTGHVLNLAGNIILQKKMAENSKNLFKTTFNAKEIYKEYAMHVESIAAIS